MDKDSTIKIEEYIFGNKWFLREQIGCLKPVVTPILDLPVKDLTHDEAFEAARIVINKLKDYEKNSKSACYVDLLFSRSLGKNVLRISGKKTILAFVNIARQRHSPLRIEALGTGDKWMQRLSLA